jgi:N-acetylated-alpha-linked acidic dipeptidase
MGSRGERRAGGPAGRRAASAGLVSLLLAAATPSGRQEPEPLLGFTAERTAAQRALEARYDGLLSADSLRAWMERLSAAPHHVGSVYGKENAEFIAGLFRSWGYEVALERFDVLFPTPAERVLEMVAPTRYRARLAEPAVAGDRTSRIARDVLPPYNAYSVDGDVTGELVYVNYGVPDDYEVLARHGIDVRGKIVIARYGGSWRGIKPKVAAEHGAIGCIIYSDPRDDGYARGDVYPAGPFRPEMGAQRGSVADMPLYPGDPLTPGVGATAEAERLDRSQARTLTTIPVLPIGYGDALPLLRALAGPVAPPPWLGALPITYHLGPGPTRVRLRVAFDWQLAPAYDVIARLAGAELPDEWVVRGNHHDGWVFGAADPVSGMVALLGEARAVGLLAREGVRPRRTIVYAAWDAEEPGLLGSTEWAEAHGGELRRHAVAYINSDGYGRGFLGMAGSHTLERFMNQIAADVRDPQTDVSVGERARARWRVTGPAAGDTLTGDLPLGGLGSGSDYTPFLQHLGLASLNIGYGGEDDGGAYHSIYDSFDHYTRFGDPSFAYGVALAQTAGRATLRLANADVLPLRLANLARHVARYLDEVKQLADSLRRETERRNALVADRAYQLAADPTETYVPPATEPAVPYLNFAPLENAVTRLTASARRYDDALARGLPSGEAGDGLNALLQRFEQALTSEVGLPRRPWFRHQVYAPGFYTGYEVKTLPAVREALEQRRWDEAEAQIRVVADVLERAAGVADSAAALVR